jgi:hypothetical protein
MMMPDGGCTGARGAGTAGAGAGETAGVLDPEKSADESAGDPPAWERCSDSCTTSKAKRSSGSSARWAALGAVPPTGRPTLTNCGEYGGGLFQLAPPSALRLASAGRPACSWCILYEKGEPILGVVDSRIDSVADSAIFYHPSFVGFSCKRGSVWQGECAILQGSDASRRCPKGSVLHCSLAVGAVEADGLVLTIGCTTPAEPKPEPEPEMEPISERNSNPRPSELGLLEEVCDPGVDRCEEWSIRRLHQWWAAHAPTADMVAAKPTDADDRLTLAARVRAVAAAAAGGGEGTSSGIASSAAGRRRQQLLCLRGLDVSIPWAGVCYSAGSFRVTRF